MIYACKKVIYGKFAGPVSYLQGAEAPPLRNSKSDTSNSGYSPLPWHAAQGPL